MRNLFIDSNIWLSLYHFTNDDLKQFGKLKELIGKDIKLFIPQQVFDEVKRNRETKLKDALKGAGLEKMRFPVFCKEYEEYESFITDYKELLKRHENWNKKINADIQNQNLPADQTIRDFFETTTLLECNSVVEKAYTRYRIGNPPGKDNKYGDAINWECLLNSVPYGEDLYLISTDKDYCSEMFDDMINPFLDNEWKRKKGSELFFYKNLTSFLSKHIKDIQLETEQEKQKLIVKLRESANYYETHGIIATMCKMDEWTEEQVEDICMAAKKNTQVGGILFDRDVLAFYSQLLSKVNQEKIQGSATKHIKEFISSNLEEKDVWSVGTID